MKAIEILKEIRDIENDYDHLKTHRFDEAIQELEEFEPTLYGTPVKPVAGYCKRLGGRLMDIDERLAPRIPKDTN